MCFQKLFIKIYVKTFHYRVSCVVWTCKIKFLHVVDFDMIMTHLSAGMIIAASHRLILISKSSPEARLLPAILTLPLLSNCQLYLVYKYVFIELD